MKRRRTFVGSVEKVNEKAKCGAFTPIALQNRFVQADTSGVWDTMSAARSRLAALAASQQARYRLILGLWILSSNAEPGRPEKLIQRKRSSGKRPPIQSQPGSADSDTFTMTGLLVTSEI
jgi:hypothetical protein